MVDEYEIPRVNRPGSGVPLPSATNFSIDTRESWQKMLLPLPNLELPLTPPRARPQPELAEVSVSPSLVGQPPTDAGTDDIQHRRNRDVNEDLDTTLKSLYRPLGGDRADALIMGARVDDMEQILLDGTFLTRPYNFWTFQKTLSFFAYIVPTLPEPTDHAPAKRTLPAGFQSLLAPPKKKNKDSSDHTRDIDKASSVRLAKISGLASLNVELSWRYVLMLRKPDKNDH